MADCFITRRGGGGTGLNFEVVGGTTKPTSSKEVTVWVNTDAQITGWAFSPDEPTNLVDDMVWFKTGTSDTISFNALKKNEIDVRPSGAYQYIDGEWKEVSAEIYQNGRWRPLWGGALFDNGDQYEAITGGWEYEASGNGTADISETIYFGGGNLSYVWVKTVKTVDLTDHKGLDINVVSRSGGEFVVYLTHENTNDVVARFTPSNQTGKISIDISNINEKCRIMMQAGNGGYISISSVNLTR